MDLQYHLGVGMRPAAAAAPSTDQRTDRTRFLLPRHAGELPLLLYPQLDREDVQCQRTRRCHERHLWSHSDRFIRGLCVGVLVQAAREAPIRRSGRQR